MLLLLLACLDPRSAGAHADACGACHTDHAAALADSAHGNAATTPLFRALRDEARRELGTTDACDTCHAPETGPGDGLSCVTCHAASGNRGTHDGLLVVDLAGPVRGPTGRAPGAPHDVIQGEFLGASDLCGTCHDSTGPAGFVETPFRHWSRSPAAEIGTTCQDCHLSSVAGSPHPPDRAPIVAGGRPRPVHDHRAVGLGRDERDAAALLGAALDISVDRDTATVTNRASGHPVPDGASFLREVVVDVEALSADGTVLATTRGWLSARLTRDGAAVPSPVLADAVHARSIAPGEHRSWTVEPADAAVVRGCVRFRRIRTELAVHLSLEVPPLVDVVCATDHARQR